MSQMPGDMSSIYLGRNNSPESYQSYLDTFGMSDPEPYTGPTAEELRYRQPQMPQIPGSSGGIEGLAEMLQRLRGGQRSPGQYPDTVPVPSGNDDLIVDFPILDRTPKPQRGDFPDYIKTGPNTRLPPRPPIFENPFGSEGRRPPRPPILDDIFGDEGQLPPMMRTNDFQDRNGNRIDDRDEKAGVKRRRIPSRRIKDSYRQRGGLAGRIGDLMRQMQEGRQAPAPRGGMFGDLMSRMASERSQPGMDRRMMGNNLAPPIEQYFAEGSQLEQQAPDMEAIRRQIMQNMRIRGIGI
jgi:hypothetical protein